MVAAYPFGFNGPEQQFWATVILFVTATYVQASSISPSDMRALHAAVRGWHVAAATGDGYAMKPESGFNRGLVPPPAVFGMVWLALFAVIGITGALAHLELGAPTFDGDLYLRFIRLWMANVVLTKLWTPLYWAGASACHAANHAVYRGKFPGKGQGKSVGYQGGGSGVGRGLLVLSILTLAGTLFTCIWIAVILTTREDLCWAAALWGVYAAWLAFAFVLNIDAARYYWDPRFVESKL